MSKYKTYFLLPIALACSLLFTGCVARRVEWSPDGTHAIVSAGDGLRLMTPDGTLSEPVLTNDAMAEWFPDSTRLAVFTDWEGKGWSDLEKFIDAGEKEKIMSDGKTVLDQIKAGRSLKEALGSLDLGDYERDDVAVYLTQVDGAKEDVGTNWEELISKKAGGIQVRIGTFEDGKLSLGPPIYRSIGVSSYPWLRVSPNGDAVGIAVETKNQDQIQLFVAPVDGSSPPQIVANNTAAFADWAPDGKSLVYVRALSELESKDDIELGALSRRAVFNDQGKLEVQKNVDDLAGLLFDQNNKVNCLKDGRIIFAAADVHLPCIAADMPQTPQLYELDPQRQAEIVPLIPRGALENLPSNPNYFEPSPDGKRVVIGGAKGAVVLLTVATGTIKTIQADGASDDDGITAPTWRSADELCYVMNATNGKPAQLVLWNNGTNRVLSANWPAAARKGFLEK